MNFKQNIAKYVTGNLTTSQLPGLAIIGIEEGYESESLIMLAGMNEGDNGFEIQEYFEKSLTELSLELPDRRNAALEFASGIAQDILNGKRDLFEGLTEIKSSALDSYDFFSETKKSVYDSIGFEAVYGLYDTYDDLLNPLSKWDSKKSIETLKSETRAELMVELKKWNEKLNNGVQHRVQFIASDFPFAESLAKELSAVLFIKLVAKPNATHHTQTVVAHLMENKSISIGPLELTLSVVFGLIYLLIILLMVADTVQFYQNPEIYSRVHHLDMSNSYWEWKYLKTSFLYIILSGFGLFGIYKMIKFKSSNWRKINVILGVIFIVAMAVGYYLWFKSGFDH